MISDAAGGDNNYRVNDNNKSYINNRTVGELNSSCKGNTLNFGH